ncbi:MAG TPA: hypothetical protein VHA10_19130 [Hypericibacter adhaerens]|jgi:hypothetical protein|uniref:hypothetical protein n=1 Tax=Hypericibacter adhaerens TaxID=2602016 RepID=UPI002C8567E7|nr:hypothetical protein [Hypericibacter adhaerens]HWA45343.1 hypothetical protein [Hypericibacter adhaerens]
MSIPSLRVVPLLAGLLLLGACSTGPQHADPQLSEMYKCNGADPMNSYSICNKKTRNDPSLRHRLYMSDMGTGANSGPTGYPVKRLA